MPVGVKKIGGRFRIVEGDSNKLATRNGRPIDGGGHTVKENALAQMRAVNANLHKKGKI